jgi:hypothetical protein
MDTSEQHVEARFLFPLGIDLITELGYDGLEQDVPPLGDTEAMKGVPRGLPIGASSITMLVTFRPDILATKGPDIRLNIPPFWERVFARFPIVSISAHVFFC